MLLVQSKVSRWYFQTWKILAWMSQTSTKPSSGHTWPPANLTYDMSKWSLYKGKFDDDTSRSLSWTILAWLSQRPRKPSSIPTCPSPNLTWDHQHWYECPKDLYCQHLDPYVLHQTTHMICENDPCSKPSFKHFIRFLSISCWMVHLWWWWRPIDMSYENNWPLRAFFICLYNLLAFHRQINRPSN